MVFKQGVVWAGAIAIAASSGVESVRADIVTLEDMNSSVTIDTGSSAGMSSWNVDGVDHLFQQWFWYRADNMTRERSIDTLTQLSVTTNDRNPLFDTRDDAVTVAYGDGATLGESGLVIQVKFSLTGATTNSGISDMAEEIAIFNFSNQAMDLSFIQYSDYDLNGTAGGDTVYRTNDNAFRQRDEEGVEFSETVVTPIPDHYEAAYYSDLVSRLEDEDLTTLDGTTGPLTGDATWAFQWDLRIGAGNSFLISKDKSIQVPAPGAAVLASLGFGMAGWIRRRCGKA
jgi:hypothetical protein